MKWSKWFYDNLKFVLIGIAIILLTAFIFNKCSNNKKQEADITAAMAQNENKLLKSDIAALQNEKESLFIRADSLSRQIAIKDALLIKAQAEAAQIALKYVKEKKRIQALSNDSAVGLFLDNADCSECPVTKYDNDYLIPPDPIRYYNDLKVDADKLKDDNSNLQTKNYIQAATIKDLNLLCGTKDEQMSKLEQQNTKYQTMDANNTKSLTAEKDKYKAEHRKLIVTKIVAGVVIVVEAVAIGAALIL